MYLLLIEFSLVNKNENKKKNEEFFICCCMSGVPVWTRWGSVYRTVWWSVVRAPPGWPCVRASCRTSHLTPSLSSLTGKYRTVWWSVVRAPSGWPCVRASCRTSHLTPSLSSLTGKYRTVWWSVVRAPPGWPCVRASCRTSHLTPSLSSLIGTSHTLVLYLVHIRTKDFTENYSYKLLIFLLTYFILFTPCALPQYAIWFSLRLIGLCMN